jgi:hypothetical protein
MEVRAVPQVDAVFPERMSARAQHTLRPGRRGLGGSREVCGTDRTSAAEAVLAHNCDGYHGQVGVAPCS